MGNIEKNCRSGFHGIFLLESRIHVLDKLKKKWTDIDAALMRMYLSPADGDDPPYQVPA
jgi:hypothetical protein